MVTEHCSHPGLYKSQLYRDYEKRTRAVVLLNALMMVLEVTGGLYLGSMALLADGFHMGTHVGALGISAFAYGYARRHACDPRYSFGTGKVSDLAGFTSAIILALIALYVIFQSVTRLFDPTPILYREAILIAALGLIVNALSAWILHLGHSHGPDHTHEGHDPHHAHHDNNFRSAYFHVLADAFTSILALVALTCGLLFGWRWMDPATGILGAFVILSWAYSLVRDTSSVLLDHTPGSDLPDKIHKILGEKDLRITDLHVWRVAPGTHAAILSILAIDDLKAEDVRQLLKPLGLAHVTVEINLK